MPRPRPSPTSTPGGSASCSAERTLNARSRVPGSVPAHADPRRPPLLVRPRVGAGRGRRGPHRDHRLRPGRAGRRRLRRPPRGRARPSTPAQSISEVESTKSVSDIYAPVTGTITEVNGDLADAPERLNEDPYGEGWICIIELDRRRPARGPARRRRLPRAGRGLGRWPRSPARSAGTATRWARTSARRAATPSTAAASTTPRSPVTIPLEGSAEEVEVELDELPAGVGMLVVTRGPNSGSRYALDEALVTAGRHPDSVIFLDDITVSRRHAEVRQVDGRLRGRRRRLAQRHLPEPGAGRGGAAARRRRAPDRHVQARVPRRPAVTLGHGRPLAPVDRRGPRASSRTTSPTSRSRRSASSRARASSTPSARPRATGSSTRPTSSGCGGSCATSATTSSR